MTMFPLSAGEDVALDYLTLDEAFHARLVHIGEVSQGGRVAELRLDNAADLPVLIVDGEELVGAKQNRTANLTVLAPPRSTIVLPVSCVEAGRWQYGRTDFRTSERAHFARGRAVKAASVSCSIASDGSRRSDQGRVWSDIEETAARLQAASPTQAMAAIFDRHRNRIEGYVAALTPNDGQTGAMFAIGAAVVGFDLFGRGATLTAMLPKLVRSYAVDAIGSSERPTAPGPEQARAFLAAAGSAKLDAYPAVGLGTDIRLTGPELAGGGLVVDGRLVHLAAFAVADERSGVDRGFPGMAGLRDRKRAARRR